MSNKNFNFRKLKKFLLGLVVIIVIVFSFTKIYSMGDLTNLDSANLAMGKNQVRFNLSEPFYVSDLVRWNPAISVVSYRLNNNTVGYVNLFNGIGENFIIGDNEDYEVILSKNITLVLPPGAGYLRGGV